jgi:hypothetical protein
MIMGAKLISNFTESICTGLTYHFIVDSVLVRPCLNWWRRSALSTSYRSKVNSLRRVYNVTIVNQIRSI